MVRVFLFVFLISFLISTTNASIVLDKVQSFVGEEEFTKHNRLIKSIFKNESKFMKNKYEVHFCLLLES